MAEAILALLVGLAVLYFTVWLFILLPAEMAQERGRSAVGWVLVSILFSPVLACLLLWLIDERPSRRNPDDEYQPSSIPTVRRAGTPPTDHANGPGVE